METQVVPLRWYSTEPIFYVYLHKRPTDGTVFYVGKGKNSRAWAKKSRNKHWTNIVEKHGGFDVEIIKEGMTEQESFAFEAEVISWYGIENLANQTLGGISTTGMVHTPETRKLQSEIAKKKIQDAPEKLKVLRERLAVLHEKQRNDPEYREALSKKIKEYNANLTPEQKQRIADCKCKWQTDPIKRENWLSKMEEYSNSPEVKARLGKQVKDWWASLTEEEKNTRRELSRKNICIPEVKAKLMEIHSTKVVVANSFIFNSIKEFLQVVNRHEKDNTGVLKKAKDSAKKRGFPFFIYKGVFVEEFDKERHGSLPLWEDSFGEIPRLSFDCLPRSKAVVSDNGAVFLSMKEAGLACDGKTWQSTADFITKRMKLGQPAMGFHWRVATQEEVIKEVLKRLNALIVEDNLE